MEIAVVLFFLIVIKGGRQLDLLVSGSISQNSETFRITGPIFSLKADRPRGITDNFGGVFIPLLELLQYYYCQFQSRLFLLLLLLL